MTRPWFLTTETPPSSSADYILDFIIRNIKIDIGTNCEKITAHTIFGHRRVRFLWNLKTSGKLLFWSFYDVCVDQKAPKLSSETLHQKVQEYVKSKFSSPPDIGTRNSESDREFIKKPIAKILILLFPWYNKILNIFLNIDYNFLSDVRFRQSELGEEETYICPIRGGRGTCISGRPPGWWRHRRGQRPERWRYWTHENRRSHLGNGQTTHVSINVFYKKLGIGVRPPAFTSFYTFKFLTSFLILEIFGNFPLKALSVS